MTAVDVNPRPWSGRSLNTSNAGQRGRRWINDLTRWGNKPKARGHGITVNGLSDPNVTVLVTLAGQSQSVAADDIGKWTAEFAGVEVPTGTVEIPVKAATTNAWGQTNTAEGVVQVET